MSAFNYVETQADVLLSKLGEKSVYDFDESDDNVHMDDDRMDDNCSECSEKSTCVGQNTVKPLKKNTQSKSIDDRVELEFEFMAGDIVTSKMLATNCDCNLYTKNGPHGNFQRWRCRDRKCRAFVLYCDRTKKCYKITSSPPHRMHTEDVEKKYWKLVGLNEMRKRCSSLTSLAGGKRLASVRSIFSTVKSE